MLPDHFVCSRKEAMNHTYLAPWLPDPNPYLGSHIVLVLVLLRCRNYLLASVEFNWVVCGEEMIVRLLTDHGMHHAKSCRA